MLTFNLFKQLKTEAQKNGGFTINGKGEKIALNSGYLVSVRQFERKYKTLKALTYNTLKKYLLIAQKTGAFVGLWYDNGLYYLDISKHYINKQQALFIGYIEQQKAIFNLSDYKSIYLYN